MELTTVGEDVIALDDLSAPLTEFLFLYLQFDLLPRLACSNKRQGFQAGIHRTRPFAAHR